MLTRLLMLIAVAGVVYLLLRRRRANKLPPKPPSRSDKLLPCPHCQRYIPEQHTGRCQDRAHCQL